MANKNKYHDGQFPPNGHQDRFHSSFSQNGDDSHEEYEIDLKQLFYTFWNRKWIIVGSILLFGFIAGIIAFVSIPIYQSSGSILINQPQNKLSGLSLGGGGALSDILSSSYGIGTSSSLDNELEILKSRTLSKAIADSLINVRLMPNGQQYPILFKSYPEDSTLIDQDTVATRLRAKLIFQKVETNASVIEVIFESPSPIEAGQMVDIALQEYKNLSTNQNRTSASSAGTFLEQEQTRIKENLRRSEEELRKFMNNNQLVQVDAQTQQLIQQMASLEARRQEARAQLVAANSGIEQYQSELNSITPGLAEQYAEAVGPNISRLQYAKSELEVQKQQLLTNNQRLRSSSPQIEEINRKIDDYKSRIRELTQELINKNDRYLGFLGGEGVAQSVSEINQRLIELQVQKSQSQAQIDVITAQLQELQQFFDNLPDNIIEFARLKRDVKINEELFLAVTQQYAETSLWEQSQFGLGRVIDDGFIPKEPEKPSKILHILTGLFLGGVIGVGYVWVKEMLNTSIGGVEKLKNMTYPLLAVIQDFETISNNYFKEKRETNFKGITISTNLVTVLNQDSSISESYRRLESNLMYSNSGTHPKSILITSSLEGEGKTATVANLGVVLAEAGYKTLMIDADFRRPGLHKMFGVKKEPGISEVLNGNIALNDAVQRTVVSDLSLFSAGGRQGTHAAVTARNKTFLDILKDLKKQYDVILIDTAPFGMVTDAAPMVNHTESVVVVAKFNTTAEEQLAQTLEQLQRIDAPLAGTVLTAYDHKKSTDTYSPAGYYSIYQG
jgi:capsular exopolysaccharide synthesis family protein